MLTILKKHPAVNLIDVGPDSGTDGGQIVFTGTPKEMLEHGDTITAKYLRKSVTHPVAFMPDFHYTVIAETK